MCALYNGARRYFPFVWVQQMYWFYNDSFYISRIVAGTHSDVGIDKFSRMIHVDLSVFYSWDLGNCIIMYNMLLKRSNFSLVIFP